MVQATLFDLDGTLVDSNGAHVAAWCRVLAAAGHDFPPDVVHGQVGKGADQFVPALIAHADPALAEQLGDAHAALFRAEFRDTIRPFASAGDLVRRTAAAGHRVVLASSAAGPEVDHYIGLLGIGAVIDAVVTADDVARSKPAPDLFAAAIAAAGCRAGDAVVVGDSPYDAIAARRADVAMIGLLSGGFLPAALTTAGAEEIYADAADLLANFDTSMLARG